MGHPLLPCGLEGVDRGPSRASSPCHNALPSPPTDSPSTITQTHPRRRCVGRPGARGPPAARGPRLARRYASSKHCRAASAREKKQTKKKKVQNSERDLGGVHLAASSLCGATPRWVVVPRSNLLPCRGGVGGRGVRGGAARVCTHARSSAAALSVTTTAPRRGPAREQQIFCGGAPCGRANRNLGAVPALTQRPSSSHQDDAEALNVLSSQWEGAPSRRAQWPLSLGVEEVL